MKRGTIRAFAMLLATACLVFSYGPRGFAQTVSSEKHVAATVQESAPGVRETIGSNEEVFPLPGGEEPMTSGVSGGRFYLGAEYLLWWFKDSPVPAPLLSSTSNPAFVPPGALSDPSGSVLLGNHNLNTDVHQGARFTAGYWITDRPDVGVEGSYFFFANKTTTQIVASGGQPGTPILAVPFFDEDGVSESSFVLASPGTSAGRAILSLSTRLQGAEVQGFIQTCEGDNFHLEVVGGLRCINLTENLTYSTFSTGLSGTNTGLVLNTTDGFGTQNTFYGVQLGARGGYQLEDFEISASAKLAIGNVLERLTNTGYAVTNFFNAPAGGPYVGVPTQAVAGAGTFVQPTNSGRNSRDHFAVVPDLALKVAYQITDSMRISAGYEFLYLSNVARPGNQIDRGINNSQTLQNTIAGNASVPGVRPAMTFASSDFWAQGINLGLEFRY